MENLKLNLIDRTKSDISWEISKFPDGEVMISLGEFSRKTNIDVICRIRSPKELFILMQVGDILKRHGMLWTLKIYYLMSARMDRVMDFNKPYSLDIVSNILKNLGAGLIQIVEPHSEKVVHLIDPFSVEIVDKISDLGISDFICYPDEGAAERYSGLKRHNTAIECRKTRTPEGKIMSVEFKDIVNLPRIKSTDVITIVDDLCDGGGTFLALHKLLKNAYPGRKINLAVVHAVQEEGLIKVCKVFNKVTVTNSYKDWTYLQCNEFELENLEVIDIINEEE